jgi:HSP20 family protein
VTTLTQDARNDLDRIKDGGSRGAGETRTLSFPVDIRETPEAFLLNADLPGVAVEDLKVQVVEGRLKISGIRRSPRALHYTRTFLLPEAVLGAQVLARLRDGVLTVKLAKPDRMRSRRIPVTADPNFTI